MVSFPILILELSFLLRTYRKFKPDLLPGDLNMYMHVLLPKLFLDAVKLMVQLLWGPNNFPTAAEREILGTDTLLRWSWVSLLLGRKEDVIVLPPLFKEELRWLIYNRTKHRGNFRVKWKKLEHENIEDSVWIINA